MSFTNKLLQLIIGNVANGADDFSVGTGAEADETALKLTGAVAMKATLSGPPYGSGSVFGAFAYRFVNEAWSAYAWVWRGMGQLWEGADCVWHGMLNINGLGLGIRKNDPSEQVRDRLDVRRGNMRVHNDNDHYSRLEAASGKDVFLLFSSGPAEDCTPKWALGRGSHLKTLPSGVTADDLIILKFKDGAWSYVSTVATY